MFECVMRRTMLISDDGVKAFIGRAPALEGCRALLSY
jgi:hypothetical protein